MIPILLQISGNGQPTSQPNLEVHDFALWVRKSYQYLAIKNLTKLWLQHVKFFTKKQIYYFCLTKLQNDNKRI